MAQDQLLEFVHGILKEKNLAGVEQEVVDQLASDLTARLEDQINSALLQQLSPEDFEEFGKLLDANDVDKLKDYFYNKNINVTEVTTGVMSRFRAAYLSS